MTQQEKEQRLSVLKSILDFQKTNMEYHKEESIKAQAEAETITKWIEDLEKENPE